MIAAHDPPNPGGRTRRVLLPALIALAIALVGGLRGAAEEGAPPSATPPAPVDAGRIAGWIEQLAADQFSQREAATRSLAGAGEAAIGPLGEAIRRGDLEVSSRAVEILRELLAGEDTGAAAAAEQALEVLAEGTDSAVADMAEATLDFQASGIPVEEVLEKLTALGASLGYGQILGGRRGLSVTLNNGWKGKAEDLRLLARQRDLVQVGVHGTRLDAASVAVLGRLRRLEQLQLFGTGVDDATIAALQQKLPDTKIDVRRGGKLGVAGQGAIGPCVIHHVQDGSAAARAGVMVGDIVLRIDGQPVKDFEILTELVGRRSPGDKIELEIERGGGIPGIEPERLKRTVELGGWE